MDAEKKQKKEELKLARRRLHDIYVRHDVAGFRAFIKDHANEKKKLQHFIDKPDEVLSDLMYEEKSKLMYLGDLWQEARNHKRMKAIWPGQDNQEILPLCANCKWFRDKPSEKEEPCMHLGSVPTDICCRAFTLSKMPDNQA